MGKNSIQFFRQKVNNQASKMKSSQSVKLDSAGSHAQPPLTLVTDSSSASSTTANEIYKYRDRKESVYSFTQKLVGQKMKREGHKTDGNESGIEVFNNIMKDTTSYLNQDDLDKIDKMRESDTNPGRCLTNNNLLREQEDVIRKIGKMLDSAFSMGIEVDLSLYIREPNIEKNQKSYYQIRRGMCSILEF
jgi:hypothetical protein